MESDPEVKGKGNSYDFGARMLDPRVGRWLTIDSKAKKYPGINPYNFVLNNPLIMKDPNGEDAIITVDAGKQTVTMSTTIYLYGSVGPDPGAVAAAYNEAFKNLNTTRVVQDANDPNKLWTVKIDYNFVYDATIAEAMDKGTNANIPEGSNTLRLTNSSSTHGESGQGVNDGFSDKSSHSVIHETGHMTGFDDRYAAYPYEPYIGDIMSNLANGRQFGGLVGPPLEIRDFHFVDLLDFALIQLPDGGTATFKTRFPEKKQVVTPIYSEGIKVQIGENVEFKETGGSTFMIDDFPGKGVEADKQKESRVKEYRAPEN
jgi:RHS repeat-associated protein